MSRLFGTDGVRGTVNLYPMTADVALRIGLAAGMLWGKGKKRRKVIIGKDTRLSGYIFESALTAGLCASGMDVLMVGPMPTPAVSFLTRSMRADLGIMISASHNPFYDNGIKIFDSSGFKLPDAVENKMTEIIVDPNYKWDYPANEDIGRAYKIYDAPGRYIVFVKNSFPEHLSLNGLRIVIDCANGANYKVAPRALEELGAEVFKIGVEPNGLNINMQCGSLYPQNVVEKIKELRADIGIALDGDADRLVLIDETGSILDGDQIMAICAKNMMDKGELPNKLLVSTVMSNMALEKFMEDRGGKLLRTAVGDRYVTEAMRGTGAMLGGEQSGHLIFRKYSTTGDGLLAALQIMSIMCEKGCKLSELAGLLALFPQKLVNVNVLKKIPIDECEPLKKAIQAIEDKLKGTGRVLVRYSGTESLCRIMIESEDISKVDEYASFLEEKVKKYLC